MAVVAINCPIHGRAVACSGPDGADVLVGTCDWGGHPVYAGSEGLIQAHRDGDMRAFDPSVVETAPPTSFTGNAPVAAPEPPPIAPLAGPAKLPVSDGGEETIVANPGGGIELIRTSLIPGFEE